ncbi:hypothetical protein LQK93_03055 [Terrabacter sp. BE26]
MFLEREGCRPLTAAAPGRATIELAPGDILTPGAEPDASVAEGGATSRVAAARRPTTAGLALTMGAIAPP